MTFSKVLTLLMTPFTEHLILMQRNPAGALSDLVRGFLS